MTALAAWSVFKRVWWLLPIAALFVALLLVRADARHWRKLAEQTDAAFKATVSNYRAAADEAARLDKANVERVTKEQAAITEKVTNDYQAAIADARARADALRLRIAAQANPGSTATASVPTPGSTASGSDDTASEEGLSVTDRLIATETAIRLIALQEWVRSQSAVDVGNTP